MANKSALGMTTTDPGVFDHAEAAVRSAEAAVRSAEAAV